VSGRQPPCDRHPALEGFVHWKRASPQASAESLPFEQLAHEVGHTFVRPEVVNCDNVWMIEGGRRASFPVKSLD